jgi:hypothetical protein
MSKSAFSAKVFALYLFILGPVLILGPNFLPNLFGITLTSEVWICVVGLLAFMLGILPAFAILDLGLGSPMLFAFCRNRPAWFVVSWHARSGALTTS